MDRLPHVVGIILNRNRTCRTNRRTLSTVDAVGICNISAKRGRNLHIGTAVRKINRAHMLNLAAHPHTVSAENTFIGIAHNRFGGGVNRTDRIRILKPYAGDGKPVCQLLQFTFAILLTCRAIPAMRSQKKLQNPLPVIIKLRRIRTDFHAVFRRCGTRSHYPSTVIFHHAHTACAVDRKIRIITKCR